MKVQCETCAARYAIADEKVAGRALRIRCKRCSAPIEIRGDLVESPADGDGGSWYALVRGEQSGPWTEEALARLAAEGTIDAETLVWREGMGDWAPRRDLFAEREPTPAVEPTDPSLTAARNESSVLFSLSNLSSLAPKAAPEAPRRTEGSGLIDIRALAAAPVAVASREEDRVDDLLALGTPTAQLGAPALGPVLGSEPRRGPSGVALALGAVGALGVLASAAVALVWVTRPAAPRGAPQPVDAPAVVVADEPAPSTAPGAAAPEPAPSVAAQAPASSDVEDPNEEAAAPSAPPVARTETPRRRPRTRVEPPAPRAAEATPRRGEPSFEELIERAGRPEAPPERPAPERPSTGPAQPTRADVRRAMDGVGAAVRACGAGGGGRVIVTVHFAGDGSVRSAAATGGDAAPPVRSCVARAVRAARVPAFTRDSFRVTYPFVM